MDAVPMAGAVRLRARPGAGARDPGAQWRDARAQRLARLAAVARGLVGRARAGAGAAHARARIRARVLPRHHRARARARIRIPRARAARARRRLATRVRDRAPARAGARDVPRAGARGLAARGRVRRPPTRLVRARDHRPHGVVARVARERRPGRPARLSASSEPGRALRGRRAGAGARPRAERAGRARAREPARAAGDADRRRFRHAHDRDAPRRAPLRPRAVEPGHPGFEGGAGEPDRGLEPDRHGGLDHGFEAAHASALARGCRVDGDRAGQAHPRRSPLHRRPARHRVLLRVRHPVPDRGLHRTVATQADRRGGTGVSNRTTRIAAGLALAACAAAVSGATPDDYGYRWALNASEAAAAHRVSLSEDVYRRIGDANLRDLEAFDRNGTSVPFGPLPGAAPVARLQVSERLAELHWFPLPASGARETDRVELHLERDAAGHLRRLDTAVEPQAAPAAASSYVLDASGLDAPIEALSFDWPDPAAPGFSIRVALSASADLV